MVKTIGCCVALLFGLQIPLKAQLSFMPIITKNKEIPEVYFKSRSYWFFPSPYSFVKKEFSPDAGRNWAKAGIIGQNLRLHIESNTEAIKHLNSYRTIRLIGMAQMWLLAPALFIKQVNETNEFNAKGPPYPSDPGVEYLLYSLASFYTGAITYHLIAKPHFIKALKMHYGVAESSKLIRKGATSYLLLSYNPVMGLPTAKLVLKL